MVKHVVQADVENLYSSVAVPAGRKVFGFYRICRADVERANPFAIRDELPVVIEDVVQADVEDFNPSVFILRRYDLLVLTGSPGPTWKGPIHFPLGTSCQL